MNLLSFDNQVLWYSEHEFTQTSSETPSALIHYRLRGLTVVHMSIDAMTPMYSLF
tara:strand:+ start:177 stop:341 length:165 start_codon:yes stop_codon:yes gene_type:complete